MVRTRDNPEVSMYTESLVWEAWVHVLLGDYDQAITRLEQYAVANPEHRFNTTEELHWWWRDLEDDSRFQALMGQVQN